MEIFNKNCNYHSKYMSDKIFIKFMKTQEMSPGLSIIVMRVKNKSDFPDFDGAITYGIYNGRVRWYFDNRVSNNDIVKDFIKTCKLD